MYAHVCFFVLFLLASSSYFFFNATPTTEIYTLSLHDALPIYTPSVISGAKSKLIALNIGVCSRPGRIAACALQTDHWSDRKSTRLNSSHVSISYAVFCLKKKNFHSCSIMQEPMRCRFPTSDSC